MLTNSTQLLLEGIKRIDVEKVKQALLFNDCDVKYMDERGRTSLHLAVLSNNLEIINLLLEKGMNINIKSYGEDQTPLHLAAFGSNTQTLDFLLYKGGDLEVKDNKNWTPLMISVITKNYENALYFLSKKANPFVTGFEDQRGLLHCAVRIQEDDICIKFINILLSYEPKLAEIQDKEGKTALHFAIKYRRDDLFSVIFKYNIQCYYIKDYKGLTPLQFSNQLGYEDISNFLEKQFEKYQSLHEMIDIYVVPLKRRIDYLESELEILKKK